MNYLESWHRINLDDDYKGLTAKDKHVVILGGGASAIDCISIAIRDGAITVTSLELKGNLPKKRPSKNVWPQKPQVRFTMPAHEDAKHKQAFDPRIYNTSTVEFIGNSQNHVTGVRTIEVKLEQLGDIMKIIKKEGTEKVIKADLVIIAVGFAGPERSIGEQFKIPYDLKDAIKTEKYQTDNPKVFAAGDCRTGETFVIKAMADAREAARYVDIFLTKKNSLLPSAGGIQPHYGIPCTTE